jgi:hypothetical protein
MWRQDVGTLLETVTNFNKYNKIFISSFFSQSGL